MSLKYEVDTLDGIDETVKPLYTEAGGKFRLKVDGIPTGDDGMADRLKKLEANNRELLEEKRKAKYAAEASRLEAAKKGGDIESIEKSWAQKLADAQAAAAAERDQYLGMVSGLTVGQTSTAVAAELFGEHGELMLPHVANRLRVDVSDGRPKVRVLDAAGNPTALTVDDLKAEIRANGRFAAFLVGSKASGGGQPGKPSVTPGKKFSEYTATELAEIRRKNPAEYDRLKAENAPKR